LSIIVASSGGPNLGFGHIRRSLVLIEYLKAKGHTPRHLISNDMESMVFQFNAELKLDLMLLIIDSPLDCSELILAARRSNIKSLTLDGNCRIEADFDISLDPRDKICDYVYRFTGFQYTIISEEISKYRTSFEFSDSSKTNRVTVSIGGGDVLEKGIDTASYLAANGFEVSLIKGPYTNYESGKDWKFRLISEPQNIGEIFANSDWMVTNCGNTLFEAMSLGKSCFVLPQTDKEKSLANFFLESGLILGYDNSLDVKNLDITNSECGRHAYSFIDDKGSERIFKILEGIIEGN
jgi:spore coat polysaccharide biosynthesis predicted glycosyltransferase SpsG